MRLSCKLLVDVKVTIPGSKNAAVRSVNSLRTILFFVFSFLCLYVYPVVYSAFF
jgi:hypothetical protein